MKATSMIVLSFGALAAAGSNFAGGYGNDDTVPAPAPAVPSPTPASAVKPVAGEPSAAAKKADDDDCETKPVPVPAASPSPVAPPAAKKVPNSEVAPVAQTTPTSKPAIEKTLVLSVPSMTMPAVLSKPSILSDVTSLIADLKPSTMVKVPGVAKPTQSAYMAAPAPAPATPAVPAPAPAYNGTTPKPAPVTAGAVSVATGGLGGLEGLVEALPRLGRLPETLAVQAGCGRLAVLPKDAKGGVQGRELVADVALIRRTTGPVELLLVGGRDRAVEPLPVVPGQDVVVHHVAVPVRPHGQVHGGARADGAGLHGLLEALDQRRQVLGRVGPHLEHGGRRVRDDVDGAVCRGDAAVYPVRGPALLPHQPQRRVGQRDGVLRVDAQPRRRGRVRRPAVVLDVEAVRGHGERVGGVGGVAAGARVRHDADVDVVLREGPGLEHAHLAAQRLLGRRAEQHHPAGQGLPPHDLGGGQGAGDRGGGDQVVAAAVAQALQGVVLGVEGHDRPAAVAAVKHGHESRVQPKRRPRHLPARLRRHVRRQQVVRPHLLVPELRVLVDLGADRPELLGERVDVLRDRGQVRRGGRGPPADGCVVAGGGLAAGQRRKVIFIAARGDGDGGYDQGEQGPAGELGADHIGLCV
ncbi:hypothetical protein PpBr36_02729 [Pyricularia pennisetigena]|uniref:hypothetical protein n=1 Tax=Pyricularia pennisetigena TaxID=1578925 RepID=UPI001152BA46|nr:hypothetical protein PpBr36_02729 [Pyricularia pennisetigena]TLS31508.1 hypothetical protein PpBr36_02729 [Pyricularia pennisetigena]